MNLLMFEKIYVHKNILMVGKNIFCPINPIYGTAFALHAHYVPVPLALREHWAPVWHTGYTSQWACKRVANDLDTLRSVLLF